MKNRKYKSYFYTTQWEGICHPPKHNKVKVYYDEKNQVVHLKKLLKKLNTGDSVLLDSISSIAVSWDVLIKTLQTFYKKSIDLCLDTGNGYSIDVDPQLLLIYICNAIVEGICLHCLSFYIDEAVIENFMNLGDEYYE